MATEHSDKLVPRILLAALLAIVAQSLEESRFTNNYRIKPLTKLTDDKMKPAKAGELSLNNFQESIIMKKHNKAKAAEIKDIVLKADDVKLLNLDASQLAKLSIDIKGNVAEDDAKILALKAKDIAPAVVSKLELIVYPEEQPAQHYAVRLKAGKLPVLLTDYGTHPSHYRFETMGTKTWKVVAEVTKFKATKLTVEDFNRNVHYNGKSPGILDQDNCLTYAGRMLVYAVGRCGDDFKLEGMALPCDKYTRSNVVDFQRPTPRWSVQA